MTSSSKPFHTAVRDLLIERGVTTKIGNVDWMGFSKSLEPAGVSYESLMKAVRGERRPGVKIMEVVAGTLKVTPSIFLEHVVDEDVMEQLDPREVGDEQATRNLERVALVLDLSPRPRADDVDPEKTRRPVQLRGRREPHAEIAYPPLPAPRASETAGSRRRKTPRP